MLRISLFGNFEVLLHGKPISAFNTPRLQSLLAYLTLNRDIAISRRQLAALFWPDMLDSQARNNLRQMVHQLRQALPVADRYLQSDMQTLRWCSDADFYLDVAAFEQSVTNAAIAYTAGRLTEMQAQLESAVSIYRGNLLADCYDDWINPERDRMLVRLRTVLTELIEYHEGLRNFPGAISYAQRLVDSDPLDESAQMCLIQLCASNNDRARVIHAYQAYVKVLEKELGIAPNQPIRECYERALSADAQAISTESPLKAIDVPTPLVGRQSEWERLQHLWQQSVSGYAHMVLISGEAGIGKSRLAEEMMIWVNSQTIRFARTRAYAAEGRLAYAPITEWLRTEAIYRSLKQLDNIWLSEVARILPELLVEMTDLTRPMPMNDQSQRQIFFESLARAVLVDRRPLLLVIDDLQWCDLETLEWLRYLLRFDTTARFLIVGTVRPEEVDAKHPLTRLLLDLRNASRLSEIDLQRLDAAESARLASYILHQPVELSDSMQLYAATEGNPLFVIEMARAGLGTTIEAEHAATLKLPDRIHALILSRFSQLSESAIDLMYLGATIGRAFDIEVLVNASERDEESVLRSLDELWQRRIVRGNDGYIYDFTHDKLREVAYAQLGPAKRRLSHRRVAQAIETVHAGDLDSVSAQLAAQYEQSGTYDLAIRFYQRAADSAARLFANNEVIALISRGRALISKLANSVQRDELELRLVTTLGLIITGANYWRVEEQLDALDRAQELSVKLGRHTNPIILKALAINKLVQNDFVQIEQIGKQLVELGEETKDPTLPLQGHQLLGITYSWLGAFDTARLNLEQATLYYDPLRFPEYIAAYSWDPKVICQCRLALDLWCLGYPEQAQKTQQASLLRAHEINHPFSIGYSSTWAIMLQFMLDNTPEALTQAEELIALSKAHGMSWWLRYATVLYGCALLKSGQLAEGITELERGIADWQTLGNKINHILLYGHLAPAYAKLGRLDRGIDISENAIALCKTQDRWYEAEMYRVYGDLLLSSNMQRAEAAFLQAISIARTQSAKSFELRAAVSLAKLWKSQDKASDALNVLSPIYAWFTEGFDTHDLKEAKALVDQLTLY